MRSQIKDSPSLNRVTHGAITPAGAVYLYGSFDWTVLRSATGVYVVRFPAFRIYPNVTLAARGFSIPYLVDQKNDWIQVNMYQPNSAGTLIDAGFMFHVEERPA